MPLKKFAAKVNEIGCYLGSFQISIYAANASFFMLLSLLPLLILLLSLISVSPLTITDLMALAQRLVPEAFLPLLEFLLQTVQKSQPAALLSFTTVTLLWAASKGTLGLINGLNAIYHVQERRNHILRRLISLGHTLLLTLSLLVMLILYIFSDTLLSLFTRLGVDRLRLFPLVLSLRHVFSMALLVLFFTLLFLILPNRRIPVKYAMPGAIVSAAGWLLFSSGFSYYVRYFSNYTALYGSLGTLLLAMLWLYLCMNILFYGGIVNYYIMSRSKNPPDNL